MKECGNRPWNAWGSGSYQRAHTVRPAPCNQSPCLHIPTRRMQDHLRHQDAFLQRHSVRVQGRVERLQCAVIPQQQAPVGLHMRGMSMLDELVGPPRGEWFTLGAARMLCWMGCRQALHIPCGVH